MNPWTKNRHLWTATLTLSLVVGMALWNGCSDDDEGENPGGGGSNNTSFVGVFSNGDENGSMNVTVNTTALAPKSPFAPLRPASFSRANHAAEAVVTASGVLRIVGGGTVNLTGTYNNVSDSLALNGGGYAFTGEHDTTGVYDSMTGQYTGPNGPGFFAALTGLTGASSYCGTFATSGSTGLTGSWDFISANGQIRGAGFPISGDPIGFEGTIATTGTSRAINAGAGQPGVYTLTVTGTLNTSTNVVSGTWTYDDLVGTSDDTGTWTGQLCP